MKPPSTIEARVAEELRNWLSSELEQLDAPNTNQFAHHVVTILLHEDLDIEDEPLNTGDDFLHDIYSIRRGKTLDKQKKAAVQFLRSAVCCNDPVEADIQVVVDELMVKIEETKNKMNSKLSPKRASSNSLNTPGVKGDSNDRDRLRLYNEAFPSLHSNMKSGRSSVCYGLELTDTDSSLDAVRSRQQVDVAHQDHIFDCQEEAYACHTARRVFLSAFPEAVFPSFEATEISTMEQMGSSVSDSFSETYSCWSFQSAFQACTLLKKFVPTMLPLKPVNQSDVRIRQFSPTVIPVIKQSDLHTVYLDPSYEKTLTEHPQLFRPIKARREFYTHPRSSADIEVDSIFSSKQQRERHLQMIIDKHHSSALVCLCDGAPGRNVEPHAVSVGSTHSKGSSRDDDDVALYSVFVMLEGTDEKPDKKAGAVDVDSDETAGAVGVGSDESAGTVDVNLDESAHTVDVNSDESAHNVDVNSDESARTVDVDLSKKVGTVRDVDTDKSVVKVRDVDADKSVVTVRDVDADKSVVKVRDVDTDKSVVKVRDVDTDKSVVKVRDVDTDKSVVKVRDVDTDKSVVTVRDVDADKSVVNVRDVDTDKSVVKVRDVDTDKSVVKVRDVDTDKSVVKVRDVSMCLELTVPVQKNSVKMCSLENGRDAECPIKLRDISDDLCDACSSEIDEICSFPQHHGGFWKHLADAGTMTLYPVVSNQLAFQLADKYTALSISPCIKHHRSAATSARLVTGCGSTDDSARLVTGCGSTDDSARLVTGYGGTDDSAGLVTGCGSTDDSARLVTGCGSKDDSAGLVTGCGSTDDSTAYRSTRTSVEHCLFHALPIVDCDCQWQLESACIQVQYYYAFRQVAKAQQGHNCCLRQGIGQNPFMPSLLSSCLSHEDSQFLQRAFVNSYFSNLLNEPVHCQQNKLSGIRCSDLEHCWLSTERLKVGGLGQTNVEVIPGCTCSSWLENNCYLGDLCPFSHPRV